MIVLANYFSTLYRVTSKPITFISNLSEPFAYITASLDITSYNPENTE